MAVADGAAAAAALLEAAPPPPPLDLEAAFAASFWAFLASFFSSFLEGPFFSSASLMVAVLLLSYAV